MKGCLSSQVPSPWQVISRRPSRPLTRGLREGRKHQVLMGVTGSGKTFTMANVIQNVQRPALVMSHNKTLAAQLYSEFKEFFPHNAVDYFVSYYDYYQPEAYIPQRDIYIEKDASINEEIDRLRLAATSALISRRDVIIVASVSCIYGLGSPEDYRAMMVGLRTGRRSTATTCWPSWSTSSTSGTTSSFEPRHDSACAATAWRSGRPTRSSPTASSFWGDEVEQLSIDRSHQRRGDRAAAQQLFVYPAKHFVLPEERIERAIDEHQAGAARAARRSSRPRASCWRPSGSSARTRFDMEMLQEVGYCPGIENYSRPLSGRPPGEPPDTLFSFFPRRFPAVRRRVARHRAAGPRRCTPATTTARRRWWSTASGCRRRLDNRPLKFEEWEERVKQVVLRFRHARPLRVARRPAARWSSRSSGPPGCWTRRSRSLRPAAQVPHLLEQIRQRAARRRARAGHHADQAAGRRPGRVLRQAGRALQVAAQRDGRLRARGTAPRPAAGATSTCWWA